MGLRRVVYLSQITTGSKFRMVGDRLAAAGAGKKGPGGTLWSSCAINDQGGNYQSPFPIDNFWLVPAAGYWMKWNPSFGWQRVYPPKFSTFNLPCPVQVNKTFPKGPTPGHGWSVFPIRRR